MASVAVMALDGSIDLRNCKCIDDLLMIDHDIDDANVVVLGSEVFSGL